MKPSTVQPNAPATPVEPATSPVDAAVDALWAATRHLALLVAAVATGGSLFFSEVLGWQPCLLCWYQRILMYPLTVLIAVGILRRDRGLHLYVLPLSIAGIGMSLYHYLLIKTDWLPAPACAVGVPCTVDYLNILGFVNIPFMALTAFVLITGLMLWSATTQAEDAPVDEDEPAQTTPRWWSEPATVAVPMILIGVVVAYVLGSTFV